MKYLPSPRILAVFFIVLALAGAGWFWYFSPSVGEQKEVYIKPGFAANQESYSQDWEKVLRESIKGSEGLAVEAPASQTPNFTDRLTQALSNTLGPRLLAGEAVNLDEISQIQNYLPEPETILGEVPEVKISELKISEANDPSSVKKYFNQVYAVYEKNFLVLKEDDLAIVARAFQNEDLSELEKIDPIILAFEKSISELKKISVPKGWENFAVRELNYLLRTRRAVEILRNAGIDPLSAMAVLQLRVNLMSEVNNFHQATKEELLKKGITFNSGEGGYILFQ